MKRQTNPTGTTKYLQFLETPFLNPALSMNRSYPRQVLECSSPLALPITYDFQSARVLAHSKTLTRPGATLREERDQRESRRLHNHPQP